MGNKKIKRKAMIREKGFSLMEVIIGVFIFSLVAVSTVAIFQKSLSGYRKAAFVQKDMESGQFAVNLMAKVLRSSEIIIPSASGKTALVRAFDYSQDKCLEYRFQGNILESRSAGLPGGTGDKTAWCGSADLGSWSPMTTGSVAGNFDVFLPVVSEAAGRVDISLAVCRGGSGACTSEGREKDENRIQATASIRSDFREILPPDDLTARYKCSGSSCVRDDAAGPFISSNCDNSCSVSGPRYKCSGGSCVRDDLNGTLTDSNCNNSCVVIPKYMCARNQCVRNDARGTYTDSNCNRSCVGGGTETGTECITQSEYGGSGPASLPEHNCNWWKQWFGECVSSFSCDEYPDSYYEKCRCEYDMFTPKVTVYRECCYDWVVGK